MAAIIRAMRWLELAGLQLDLGDIEGAKNSAIRAREIMEDDHGKNGRMLA